jgi:hypothetical protein
MVDFKLSELVDEFIKGYDERDETQVEWLITNIVEFGRALDKLKKLVIDKPEPKPVRVQCTNDALLPKLTEDDWIPICWKCVHVLMERQADDSYTVTGCEENRNIRSWEDAKTMCPAHKPNGFKKQS